MTTTTILHNEDTLAEKLAEMGFENYAALLTHTLTRRKIEIQIRILEYTRLELKEEIREAQEIEIDQEMDPEIYLEVIDLGFDSEIAARAASNSVLAAAVVSFKSLRTKIYTALGNLIAKFDLSPEKVAEENESLKPKPKKKPKKSPKKPVNQTKRRLLILASLYREVDYKDIAHVARVSGISERNARAALNSFIEIGYIRRERHGRRYVYYLTRAGEHYLLESVRTLWQCDLDCQSKSHCQNIRGLSQSKIIALITQAQKITSELLKRGWYHRNIQRVLQQHKLSYVQTLVHNVGHNDRIENQGAYLYVVLLKETPDEVRLENISRKILKELPQNLVKAYRRAAATLIPREYVYLANAMRKTHQKGHLLTEADVGGMADWVRKQIYRGERAVIKGVFGRARPRRRRG